MFGCQSLQSARGKTSPKHLLLSQQIQQSQRLPRQPLGQTQSIMCNEHLWCSVKRKGSYTTLRKYRESDDTGAPGHCTLRSLRSPVALGMVGRRSERPAIWFSVARALWHDTAPHNPTSDSTHLPHTERLRDGRSEWEREGKNESEWVTESLFYFCSVSNQALAIHQADVYSYRPDWGKEVPTMLTKPAICLLELTFSSNNTHSEWVDQFLGHCYISLVLGRSCVM